MKGYYFREDKEQGKKRKRIFPELNKGKTEVERRRYEITSCPVPLVRDLASRTLKNGREAERK